jgi:alpha-galactosidase
MKKLILIIIFFCIANMLYSQKYEKLAQTPPMGWNSWNCFLDEIDEAKIKSIADAMVRSGMRDAGYQYIVIDDGWMSKSRDKNGHIIADSIKFPSGIKALVDYVHNLDLKFGLYSVPGCLTCQQLMGSLGHEKTDADDYASWGVDFLKYDWCNYPKGPAESKITSREDCLASFALMGECLMKTGRPILYSVHDVCGQENKYASLPWIKSISHMHRTSNDIFNNWERMLMCLESTADLWKYAGPGYWNDPDMLEVGNTRKGSRVPMNLTEYRTHFSMWCIVAAPLMAGNDLRTMTPEIIEILTNKELIALNQDPLGKQGRRIRDDGDIEVWGKELSENRYAVTLLNRTANPADITVTWKELGLEGEFNVRNLWMHKNVGKFKDSFTGKNIQSHEAMVILLTAGK